MTMNQNIQLEVERIANSIMPLITDALEECDIYSTIDDTGLRCRLYTAIIDSMYNIYSNNHNSIYTSHNNVVNNASNNSYDTHNAYDAHDTQNNVDNNVNDINEDDDIILTDEEYDDNYHTNIDPINDDIEDYNGENKCIECGVDMGPHNPRQLCGKTYCRERTQF